MKRHSIINSIITMGFLFAGQASASSTQENDTDMIYGNSSVVPSQSEAHVTGTSERNGLEEDMIYGKQKTSPSRGEPYERFVNNRDNNTDFIYGS